MVQESWLIFNYHLLQVKEQSIPCMDEQGHSNKTQAEEEYTEDGSRYGKSERNTKILSEHTEMQLQKPKSIPSVACQREQQGHLQVHM